MTVAVYSFTLECPERHVKKKKYSRNGENIARANVLARLSWRRSQGITVGQSQAAHTRTMLLQYQCWARALATYSYCATTFIYNVAAHMRPVARRRSISPRTAQSSSARIRGVSRLHLPLQRACRCRVDRKKVTMCILRGTASFQQQMCYPITAPSAAPRVQRTTRRNEGDVVTHSAVLPSEAPAQAVLTATSLGLRTSATVGGNGRRLRSDA